MNTAPGGTAAILPRRHPWAGFLLGVGMGGFFDGILLHQILQWHHLLSGLGGRAGDLRVQVVADGVFHALMYAVAAAGLWSLYRSRGASAPPRRALLASFFVGFGAWHVIDAVLSHWLIGIHRLRMDVADPLPWELAWVGVFGVLPLAAGLLMRRPNPPGSGGSGSGSGGGSDSGLGSGPGNGSGLGSSKPASRLSVVLAVAITTAAVLNLYPLSSPAQDTSVVVLRPGASAAGLLAALDGTPARIMWADASGGVWVLADAPRTTLVSLFGAGALYVSGATAPAGCSAWVVESDRTIPLTTKAGRASSGLALAAVWRGQARHLL